MPDPPKKPKNVSNYLNRQSIYDLFPIAQNDIVFVGDSHIQRFDVQEYLPGFQIKNRGNDGERTAGLLSKLKYITEGKPNKVFIEIGINDLLNQITPDSACKNIHLIIYNIKKNSPQTRIYLNNIFPSNHKDLKPLIIQLNNKLAKLAKDEKIPLIDINSKLNDKGGLNKLYDGNDGVHLNGQGYLVWTNVIKPYFL